MNKFPKAFGAYPRGPELHEKLVSHDGERAEFFRNYIRENGPQTVRQLAQAWADHQGVTDDAAVTKVIKHTRAWVLGRVRNLELEQLGTARDEYDSKMYGFGYPKEFTE